MEHVDARRALELLIDVVDKYGEETLYEKVPLDHGHPGCRYEYNGAPSCLVGHALVMTGAPLEVLRELDAIGAPADRIYTYVKNVHPDAGRVFQAAQDVQDRGGSWGEALDEARNKYESMKGQA